MKAYWNTLKGSWQQHAMTAALIAVIILIAGWFVGSQTTAGFKPAVGFDRVIAAFSGGLSLLCVIVALSVIVIGGALLLKDGLTKKRPS